MARPRISRLNTRQKFEENVIKAINIALHLLIEDTNIPRDANEIVLNFHLHKNLKVAYIKMSLDRKYTFNSPHFAEANNQPSTDDTEHSARLYKRPDFQWSIIDHSLDPDNCTRYVVLECKRLGIKKKNREFNKLYVENGVHRFVDEIHSYAKDCESAIMVGYMQDSDGKTIMEDVNKNLDSLFGYNHLELERNEWLESGVSILEHNLTRDFPISPFHLRHFWVDLR